MSDYRNASDEPSTTARRRAMDESRRIEEWHNNAPLVHHVAVRLTQPGNTMGTTAEWEELEISLNYQMPEANRGDDCFVVIKSQTGWSMNEAEDLQAQVAIIIDMARQLTKPLAAAPAPSRTIDLHD